MRPGSTSFHLSVCERLTLTSTDILPPQGAAWQRWDGTLRGQRQGFPPAETGAACDSPSPSLACSFVKPLHPRIFSSLSVYSFQHSPPSFPPPCRLTPSLQLRLTLASPIFLQWLSHRSSSFASCPPSRPRNPFLLHYYSMPTSDSMSLWFRAQMMWSGQLFCDVSSVLQQWETKHLVEWSVTNLCKLQKKVVQAASCWDFILLVGGVR